MFFFSSRRRHTRSLRDWSSDVCSSDLGSQASSVESAFSCCVWSYSRSAPCFAALPQASAQSSYFVRSEERRVGKECRSRGPPDADKNKVAEGGGQDGRAQADAVRQYGG